MEARERERLLARLDRGSTRVGGRIPAQITVQNIEVDLREFVFELTRLDSIPEAERERAEEMTRLLKRERLQRRQRIERSNVTREEAEQLADSIVGLERAVNALENLDARSFEEQAHAEWVDNQKQWLSFLRQVR